MNGKPYFRVGVAGLDPRDWRLIEIVFKHSQYNRFEFRLVQSYAPDAVDVLIVNSVEPEGLNTLAQIRSAGRNIPVISAVPRGAPNASRYAISIDRLTLQLLPILNRVVEAEILSPATRPMDAAPGSAPGSSTSHRIASPPSARPAAPVSPAAGGVARPSAAAGAASSSRPAHTAQPAPGLRPATPASPPGQPQGLRPPQAAAGTATGPGTNPAAGMPRPAPGQPSPGSPAHGAAPRAFPPGAAQDPRPSAPAQSPSQPSQSVRPGTDPAAAGRPGGSGVGAPGAQRPTTTGTPGTPAGPAARPVSATVAPGRPFGDLQPPREPQAPADPTAGAPRAAAPGQRPPGTRHASNLVAFPGGAQIGGQRLRVMVVDDSPTVRQQLSAAFERMGVICEAVGSAADAIERLDDQHYDLVLVDVVMPEMDGYRLTREIKKSKRHRSVPVIILTSRSSPFDLARGALAGCDTYLTKPVPLRALEAAVVKQLRKALAIDDLSGLIRTSSDATPTRRGGTDGDTRPFPGPQSRNVQR